MKKKKKVLKNLVVDSLNILYNPSLRADDSEGIPTMFDPSGVPNAFQSVRQLSTVLHEFILVVYLSG